MFSCQSSNYRYHTFYSLLYWLRQRELSIGILKRKCHYERFKKSFDVWTQCIGTRKGIPFSLIPDYGVMTSLSKHYHCFIIINTVSIMKKYNLQESQGSEYHKFSLYCNEDTLLYCFPQWMNGNRKRPNRRIPTGHLLPGKLPPKKIPTQDNSHLNKPTRKIPTQDNYHPEFPTRIISI